MKFLRPALLAICLLFGSASPALARVNIDINLSLFPELVPIPGYPVYYAPRVDHNYFFYDGRYWTLEGDDWFVSDWYNGPWDYVDPYDVPVFVLRVPVRYYRRPPPYFRGWYVDAPPRWGYRWGDRWEHDHRGWDHWDRRHIPTPARLPLYQRDYRGDRYPSRSEQHDLRERYYGNRHRDDDNGNRSQRHRDDDRERPQQNRGAENRPQPQQRIPQVQRNSGDLEQAPRNVEHRNAQPQRGNSIDERGPGRNRDDNRQPSPRRGNGGDKNDGGNDR